MKKLIIGISLYLFFGAAFGQQKAQYSQYMVNPYILNPAYGGVEPYYELAVGGRAQWLNYDGAPTTAYASANMPLGRELGPQHGHFKAEHRGWHAIGGYAFTDATGPTSRAGFLFSYGYNLPLYKNIRMSISLAGGFQQFKLNGDNFLLYDVVDPTVNGEHVRMKPDMVAGAYVYDKHWFVGYSSHQLLRGSLDLVGGSGQEGGNFELHHFLNAGIVTEVSDNHQVVPSFMIKQVSPAPVSLDFNCMFREREGKYFMGLSYRGLDSFAAIAGMLFKRQWQVSYSVDLTHSELRKYNAGSHEIHVIFRWPPVGHLLCPSKYW